MFITGGIGGGGGGAPGVMVPEPIPEPSTLLLIGTAVAGLLVPRRRKARRQTDQHSSLTDHDWS
jgi:hypothetical protein